MRKLLPEMSTLSEPLAWCKGSSYIALENTFLWILNKIIWFTCKSNQLQTNPLHRFSTKKSCKSTTKMMPELHCDLNSEQWSKIQFSPKQFLFSGNVSFTHVFFKNIVTYPQQQLEIFSCHQKNTVCKEYTGSWFV